MFKSVDSEQLVPMRHEGGKDEIGSMIRSYNRMAARTNELIQTVYKNKTHRTGNPCRPQKCRTTWHCTARLILIFCLMPLRASA